jgi:membrane protein YdbS with pleckstrin-like domain
MKEYKMPRKTLHLWQFRVAAIGLLLSALCGYFYFKLKPFLIIIIAIFVAFLVVTFWYLPAFFKGCSVKRSNDAVIVKWGVIFKNTHILPFSRLIYAQSLTTPLARALGLKGLTLKAARQSIFIPELQLADADELINGLKQGDEQ